MVTGRDGVRSYPDQAVKFRASGGSGAPHNVTVNISVVYAGHYLEMVLNI